MNKQIKEAVEFFEGAGFLEELTSDKKHYVEILLKAAKGQIDHLPPCWTYGDLQGLDASLTEEDCEKISEKILSWMDATEGLNWDSLGGMIQRYREKNPMKLDLKTAKRLWESLGNIPVGENDQIEESFMEFEVGEYKEEIWHWFEETFNISVAEDLMGLTK